VFPATFIAQTSPIGLKRTVIAKIQPIKVQQLKQQLQMLLKKRGQNQNAPNVIVRKLTPLI